MQIQIRKLPNNPSGDIFLWKPANSQKEYAIHRRNVLLLGGPDKIREVFNTLYQHKTLQCQATYFQGETKTLVLEVD